MRYAYPHELAPQAAGGFTVTFPDVPEAITQGESEGEAAAMAEDALVAALSFYTDNGEPLPRPSPADGRKLAYVPPLVAAKLALHDIMLAAGISNVVLARRLGVDEKIVRRLRDPCTRVASIRPMRLCGPLGRGSRLSSERRLERSLGFDL
jgi:antitoxin HicB